MSFILQVDFNWLRFFINNHSKIEKNRNKEQNMVIQLGVSSWKLIKLKFEVFINEMV